MATVLQALANLKAISRRTKLEQLLFDIVKDNKRIFLSLNKQQLARGEDTDGNIIGTYSSATELESLFGDVRPRQPKVEGQPYNFEWTGNWFDNFFLDVRRREAIFGSKGEANEELTSRYNNLFGLDDENLRNVIRNTLYPQFMKQVRSRLKL